MQSGIGSWSIYYYYYFFFSLNACSQKVLSEMRVVCAIESEANRNGFIKRYHSWWSEMEAISDTWCCDRNGAEIFPIYYLPRDRKAGMGGGSRLTLCVHTFTMGMVPPKSGPIYKRVEVRKWISFRFIGCFLIFFLLFSFIERDRIVYLNCFWLIYFIFIFICCCWNKQTKKGVGKGVEFCAAGRHFTLLFQHVHFAGQADGGDVRHSTSLRRHRFLHRLRRPLHENQPHFTHIRLGIFVAIFFSSPSN